MNKQVKKIYTQCLLSPFIWKILNNIYKDVEFQAVTGSEYLIADILVYSSRTYALNTSTNFSLSKKDVYIVSTSSEKGKDGLEYSYQSGLKQLKLVEVEEYNEK